MTKLKLVFEDDSHIDEYRTELKNWLIDINTEGGWGWEGSIVDVEECELYLEYSIINDDITVQDIVDDILGTFSFISSIERVEDVKS